MRRHRELHTLGACVSPAEFDGSKSLGFSKPPAEIARRATSDDVASLDHGRILVTRTENAMMAANKSRNKTVRSRREDSSSGVVNALVNEWGLDSHEEQIRHDLQLFSLQKDVGKCRKSPSAQVVRRIIDENG